MARPLDGITILDLTWILSGPYASMVLCDLGAEVIKVERPPNGDISRTTGPYQNGFSSYYFSVNRGKKSMAIDLRKPEGRDLFLRLAEKVDVVMENFTPGTMDRLGIGWEALSKTNPSLIMASTSGFGQTGPYRDRPALDIIVQAMGGVMSITGELGGRPVRPGVSFGDVVAGLYTAIGILAALQERNKSGLGQHVDISMLDCQVSVLENAISRYFVSGETPKPLGTRHPMATPFQAFPTADGYLVVALGFGVVDQWTLLCSLLETPDLIDDERFNTGPKRTRNHSVLEPLLEAAFRKKTTGEWLELLLEAEIPCGPIQTIDQVVRDPQVVHRDMIQEITHPKAGTIPIANTPVRMSRSESGIKGPPADFGEHTADVLGELLGIAPDDVTGLVERGVVMTEGGPDIESLLK
ncbi:MAG: CaiB/BaiF CoA-transferase family protein [Dehalococcoidia bacterium]|nr:CoA transferase [Dehalococcoidia bacterium]MCB9485393.1 CoA transferase [Thermoflexaceae bacterium]